MCAILATELIEARSTLPDFTREEGTAALVALQQLHDHGVLHGDIHPGNVIVDEVSGLRTLHHCIL